ncbi:NUDIX hydrolase [Paraclostridium sordellii]|uniref:Nudix domain protein n=1 Tax=Paraclostridium sordellii TaxID=1505 RepID=A0A9P1KY44_PARSO|nr:NUDIX hydrolase [Paeniclostridium sordellii]EPZ58199.1 NUDIX domain protein [[Clostridium] sordellii VPI 9048] [Paeniclostridium sordellii VPI 9048]CEK34866.1 nudix domain protein,NUDIX domain [[Clostridium] sordellii] [Paeniclostridium sordellii]CEK37239.1 hydrolase, NUDIX family [[Clostridium] sordellii] [Paeniclostridium sordellii]CEN84959.1 nudix domain protein [[Clostridium] sordellii] [Paeniclostridium sordellii]CEO32291.1 nudix domain protein [[Clostridium] sordellii] [Paeniclostridi
MNFIEVIKKYEPINEQEINDKSLILKCINEYENILSRENELCHMTSSGFIVNKNRDKVLMIHHNIYNSWGWTGGHADGDSDLLHVAIKEAREETGLKNVRPITNEICSIEILPVSAHVKKGKYVSAHLHLSIAYILEADESEKVHIKADENSGVKWICMNQIESYVNEKHMISVYNKLIKKAKLL